MYEFPREIKPYRAFRKELLGTTTRMNLIIEFLFVKMEFQEYKSHKEGYRRIKIIAKPNFLGKVALVLMFPIDVLYHGLGEFEFCWECLKSDITGNLWTTFRDVKDK